MDKPMLPLFLFVIACLMANTVLTYLRERKDLKLKKDIDQVRDTADVIADGIEKSQTQSELNFWQNEIALLYHGNRKLPAITDLCSRLHALVLNKSMFLQATNHIKDARNYL